MRETPINKGSGLGAGRVGRGIGSGDKSKPKVPAHRPPRARVVGNEANVVHPKLKKMKKFGDRGYLKGRGTF